MYFFLNYFPFIHRSVHYTVRKRRECYISNLEENIDKLNCISDVSHTNDTYTKPTPERQQAEHVATLRPMAKNLSI